MSWAGRCRRWLSAVTTALARTRTVKPSARRSAHHAVNRRAKYLLVETDAGILMVHLGMSGS